MNEVVLSAVSRMYVLGQLSDKRENRVEPCYLLVIEFLTFLRVTMVDSLSHVCVWSHCTCMYVCTYVLTVCHSTKANMFFGFLQKNEKEWAGNGHRK